MGILEAGHYYVAKGPTLWSLVGWELMQRMKTPDDKSMLFMDDIHSMDDVSPEEALLPTMEFFPNPDFTIMESAVKEKALEALEMLKALSKKKRAMLHSGVWYCSGFPLTTPSGKPICVLLDLALTLLKKELGAEECINILPKFYEEEQRKLLRLVPKVLPNFRLQVVLYDLEGNLSSIKNEA
ncbi:MAG: hypothetical protein Q7S16_01400 [bacterium]|nr:hypothetical protein [bacterium]